MKASSSQKIIVSVAPVGKDISKPSSNPFAPDEVAHEVIQCGRAGASMVHLHVRDREGYPTEDLTAFSRTLDLIRQESDIILQGSTGGLTTLSLEERCVCLNDPRVEVASLNMGSVNFGETVYINTLPDIRFWASRMREADVIPELEIFEAGMIQVAQKLVEEDTLSPPFGYNFCLGVHWAIPADPRSLGFLKSLLPEGARWGVLHDKMNDLSLLAMALGTGASVARVGFEDSVYYAPGQPAKTNVELVEKLVALIRSIGFEPATPEEARRALKVKR
jgi:3-keto-5-aminohexanoate cleavage enzyme